MVKSSTIISVSISTEEANFLDEHNLSPSELMQEKIQENMRLYKNFNDDKAKLLKNIEGMQAELTKIYEYLDYSDKLNDFRKWRGENVLVKEK